MEGKSLTVIVVISCSRCLYWQKWSNMRPWRKKTCVKQYAYTGHCKLSHCCMNDHFISSGNCVLCCMRLCECVCVCVCVNANPGWGTCRALSNISRPICWGRRKLILYVPSSGWRLWWADAGHPLVREGGLGGPPSLLSPTPSFPGFLSLSFSHFPLLLKASPCVEFCMYLLVCPACVCVCVCVLCQGPVIKSHGT